MEFEILKSHENKILTLANASLVAFFLGQNLAR